MVFRKTESRKPISIHPSDPCEYVESADGHYSPIFLHTYSLVVARLNTYTPFVSNPALSRAMVLFRIVIPDG